MSANPEPEEEVDITEEVDIHATPQAGHATPQADHGTPQSEHGTPQAEDE
jgi:hypothetical protein